MRNACGWPNVGTHMKLVLRKIRSKCRRGLLVEVTSTVTLVNKRFDLYPLPVAGWRRAINMASVTTKLSFVVLKIVMMLLGGLFTLFGILLAIITHPCTVFKKVPRNGESSVSHRDVATCILVLESYPAPTFKDSPCELRSVSNFSVQKCKSGVVMVWFRSMSGWWDH